MDSLATEALTIDLSTLAERRIGFGVLIEDGVPSIVTGSALAGLRRRINLTPSQDVTISGVTAVAGRVEASARVITIVDEVPAMRRGEILVAPMTSPYHVPAMAMAGAIVTDEGGILSHAAIISRELGIPCVVGTKDATARIRTGDVVRVHADPALGTVEITTPYGERVE
jgi:pyruvate,water dikinase